MDETKEFVKETLNFKQLKAGTVYKSKQENFTPPLG
jgi:hypothetical protein